MNVEDIRPVREPRFGMVETIGPGGSARLVDVELHTPRPWTIYVFLSAPPGGALVGDVVVDIRFGTGGFQQRSQQNMWQFGGGQVLTVQGTHVLVEAANVSAVAPVRVAISASPFSPQEWHTLQVVSPPFGGHVDIPIPKFAREMRIQTQTSIRNRFRAQGPDALLISDAGANLYTGYQVEWVNWARVWGATVRLTGLDTVTGLDTITTEFRGIS